METIGKVSRQVLQKSNARSPRSKSSRPSSGPERPTDEGLLYIEHVLAGRVELKPSASGRHCPSCRSLGWLREDHPLGHPRFGELIACPLCRASPAERQQHLALLSNLIAGERRVRFEQVWTTTPARREALMAARELVRSPGGWLTLWGGNGTGKTFLATAIVNESIAREREARYWILASLLDHLRDAYRPDGPGYSNLFHDLVVAPVLVLDEIQAHNATDWAREKLRQLLNERHRRITELITVLVMNIAPAQLPDWLGSRASQFTAIELNDGDVRPMLQDGPA